MQGCRHKRNRYNRKVLQLPKLSLGLTSVKLIVDKFEEDYTRAVVSGGEIVKYDPNIDRCYDDFPFDKSKGRVWKLFIISVAVLNKYIPSVSYGNLGTLLVLISALGPKMLSYLVLYPLCRLVFGTLYPAYASYKAVRTKNLKEYVKWMMYWIVFALFTCTETFTDMFLSWFPFYYEVKIILVLWLLSPATKGSSFLYRKFVHPALCRREQEIDEYIAKAKDQGYHTVLNLGTKGVNYATTVIMQTAIKNLNLPRSDGDVRADTRGIISRDMPDGFQEYQYENEYHDLPQIVDITELHEQENEIDFMDPDYEPGSSARSRGNVARKRKVAKEGKPRSRSRGRKTRSQTVKDKELVVD